MQAITYLLLVSLLLLNNSVFADSSVDLGIMASNIIGPLEMASSFVAVACLLVSVSCLFAAVVKYFAHRRNPLAVPMGKVVWLIIVAIMLLLIPVSFVLSGHGEDLMALLR
jgi:hypothetical protein